MLGIGDFMMQQLSRFFSRLPRKGRNGCKRGIRNFSFRHVIKADNVNIFARNEPGFSDPLHDAERDQITEAENRGRALRPAEELRHGFTACFAGRRAVNDIVYFLLPDPLHGALF